MTGRINFFFMIAAFTPLPAALAGQESKHFGRPCDYRRNLRQDEVKTRGGGRNLAVSGAGAATAPPHDPRRPKRLMDPAVTPGRDQENNLESNPSAILFAPDRFRARCLRG
jgi:hypothetical protein